MRKTFIKSALAVFTFAFAVMGTAVSARAYDGILQTTKSIKLNTTITDSLSEGDAKYTFNIPESGALTVELGVYEGSNSSWGSHGGITLYDKDGNQISTISVRDRTKETDRGKFTADIVAGDYYLVVNRATGTINYEVITNYEKSGETIKDTLSNTHNSKANPAKLTIGKLYKGHIALNGKEDVYTFTNKKSQFIKFALTDKTDGITIKVENANGTVSFEETIKDRKGDVKVFCPKGKYYVTICDYTRWNEGATTGTYTIKTSTAQIPVSKVKKVVADSSSYYSKYIKVTFTIRSTEDVAGYEIQFAKDAKFKRGRQSKEFENTSYLQATQSVSVPGKGTYYVRIRTFQKDNRGNHYNSKWSAAKKVTVR